MFFIDINVTPEAVIAVVLLVILVVVIEVVVIVGVSLSLVVGVCPPKNKCYNQ